MGLFYNNYTKLLGLLFVVIFLAGGENYFYKNIVINNDFLALFKQQTKLTTQAFSPPITANPSTISVMDSGRTSFLNYTIAVPVAWQIFKQYTTDLNTLTLSKNDYQMSINQSDNSAFSCSFTTSQESAESRLFSLTDSFSLQNTLYKVGLPMTVQSGDSPLVYEVCEQQNDESFRSPTKYGRIQYVTPKKSSLHSILEMNSILQSMK